MFVQENLNQDLMSDSSTIAHKSSDIVISNQDINYYSIEDTNMKDLFICGHEFADLFPLFHFNHEYHQIKHH